MLARVQSSMFIAHFNNFFKLMGQLVGVGFLYKLI